LHDVYGTAGPIDHHPFDGKTDPQIARELLAAAGFPDPDIDRGLSALWNAYLTELAIEMGNAEYQTRVYPGVPELLAALAQEPAVVLGLLTGNVARGADLKLSSVGLREYFSFGAFGSDCEQRNELPQVAVARAREVTGRSFAGADVVIIGDTPADIRCGEALGVFTVGVTTGRHQRKELVAEGADVVFDDFSNTRAVLRALLPLA
jgi:phosphoglycolate phosphatase-like HAD superfamily hydrolase